MWFSNRMHCFFYTMYVDWRFQGACQNGHTPILRCVQMKKGHFALKYSFWSSLYAPRHPREVLKKFHFEHLWADRWHQWHRLAQLVVPTRRLHLLSSVTSSTAWGQPYLLEVWILSHPCSMSDECGEAALWTRLQHLLWWTAGTSGESGNNVRLEIRYFTLYHSQLWIWLF